MLKTHAEITATAQTGETFRSKAALRRALEDAPGFVTWRAVAGPPPEQDRYLTTPELIAEIQGSAVLVGPHPETDRRYYGTVTVKAGKLVVK